MKEPAADPAVTLVTRALDAAPNRAALLRLALSLTRDRDEAEDLVQEALLRAWQRASTYRAASAAAARPWLAAILRNTCINLYHERRRRGEAGARVGWTEAIEQAVFDSAGRGDARTARNPTENALLARGQYSAVLAAVERLPVHYRLPLLLATVEGASYEEIGVRLGLPLGTVRSRVHRARERVTRATVAWAEEEGAG